MKASTSRGGGRREVGGEGDKQRADLAEETLRASVLEETGRNCNGPAGEDPRPASATHVSPGLQELHVKTEVRNNQVQKHHPQQVDQAPSLSVRDPEQQGEA